MKGFFLSPPEKTMGVVLHVQGDLAFPRFRPEAGTHIIKERNREQICLIEVVRTSFAEYAPPAGIERPGAIKAKGAPVCRTFEVDAKRVKDRVLGERPWEAADLQSCVTELIEDRLKLAIEAIIK
jgi:hypothetical protein